MIKGINKQSIVVKGDGKIFEQAIFIVNPKCTLSQADIMKEAELLINQKTFPLDKSRKVFSSRKKFGRYEKLKYKP